MLRKISACIQGLGRGLHLVNLFNVVQVFNSAKLVKLVGTLLVSLRLIGVVQFYTRQGLQTWPFGFQCIRVLSRIDGRVVKGRGRPRALLAVSYQ